MKIGIDARMYRSSVAGIGRYSQNLIKNLLEIDQDDEFVLFMTPKDKEEFDEAKINHGKVKIVLADIAHYSLGEQTKLLKIIENEHLDLMHFLNFNYPVRYKGKFVVTIHDLTLLFFPQTAKETNFVKRKAYNYTMQKACQNAAKIIAVSQSTKKDIVTAFKTPPGKISVIYEAADDKIFAPLSKPELNLLKEKYQINEPVILCVGQFRPHKNLPGLVEAFGILRRQLPAKLVILGKKDAAHARLQKAIDQIDHPQDVIMPGFVANDELAAWYELASCFVFPSFYEGFGLPGLEAMQAGTPVVASKASSLPEIYQDAAIYFDPFKTEEISAKMKSVLQDKELQKRLITQGKKVAQCYSWQKTAVETLKVYKSVINSD